MNICKYCGFGNPPNVGECQKCGAPCRDAFATPKLLTLEPLEYKIGIDVSHWDGTIDWDDVKPNIAFAIVKATEGTNYIDDKYFVNKTACKSLGIPVGAYHFFRSNVDPIAQAEYFVSTVNDKTIKFMALDVETNNGNFNNQPIAVNVHNCLIHLESLLGFLPVIYTGAWFWNPNLGYQNWASRYLNWIGTYGIAPIIPLGWDDCDIWQYSSSGQVPGVPTRVDMNKTQMDLATLFGIEAPPPPVLPEVIRVIARDQNGIPGNANIRQTPMGIIKGTVPYGTLLGIDGSGTDGDGDKWWKCGSVYIASWLCETYK